ncbi:amino acid transporter [Hyphopichia burtonii NRRL Y-1933]|uniref:Amino acid transporter n=1 Tax=Hyphopichia burtonii NRRL Y-1933 TaxID=984485 RepID=A0A1E4RHL9_9ASCO|nr:amino acid transporter [Hyphopichia burtonii NRRL Y-1933]ODV66759.1 amino acid transporter [Hyphopichia burtonii NRRL Y-1933]
MSRAKKILNPFFGGDIEEINFDSQSHEAGEYSIKQNAKGAPVEKVNPLGYNLDYVTAFYMVLQGMIGTGIFATPGSVVKSMGSIGSTYVLWVSGFFIMIMELSVYIEYLTYFRLRNGADVAFLEQAYPKPDFMIPTTYAAVSVCLSYLNSSSIAFGTYILLASGVNASAWAERGVGIAILTFTCILAAVSSKLSLKLSNFLGFVKLVFMLFIVISGLVVLGGGSKVKDPHSIFKNPWEGTTTNGNAISSAILKVSFSYGGTQYCIMLAGEADPRKSKNLFRFFIPAVVFFVCILYILVITSYYAGIGSVKEISDAGTLISSVYFSKVFGTSAAQKALDVLVALAALGHLLASVVGQSRVLRECGRQGVLPYSKLWTSTKPWGTPILPIIVMWVVNVIVSLAPPPGDAFNFVVDMGSYSGYIFKILLVVGLLLVRKQREKAGLGFVGWKVPLPVLVLVILYEIFVFAMAFVPPADGTLNGSDVSFFYCAYALTTIGIICLCLFYYYVWAKVLPKLYNYEHRVSLYSLENGEQGHTVVKVNKQDLERWDAEHYENGKLIDTDDASSVENITVSLGDNNKHFKL